MGITNIVPKTVRIDSNNNVGIGTNSPSDIAGFTSLTLNSPTNGGLLDIQNNGTTVGRFTVLNNEFNLIAPGSFPINFFTDSAERIRITSAGNLGIGTTVPSSNVSIGTTASVSTASPITLDLGGTFSSTAGSNAKLKIYWDGTATYGLGASSGLFNYLAPSSGGHGWYSGTTQRMSLTNLGNVGMLASDTNGVRISSLSQVTLADDATLQLDLGTAGGLIISAYDPGAGIGSLWYCVYTNTAFRLVASTSTAAADTDGNLCVFKNANAHTVTLKNRLGASKNIRIAIMAAQA
jgi:hypothetical protein